MRARFIAVRLVTMLSVAAVLCAASAVGSAAHAQGRKGAAPAAAKVPPGQAKKQVTTAEAVVLTRNLLVKHGFTVVRVETVKGAEVIYYRAGNQGRGRGLGPVKSMIVRPAGSIVTFESAPESVRLDIRVQLGF